MDLNDLLKGAANMDMNELAKMADKMNMGDLAKMTGGMDLGNIAQMASSLDFAEIAKMIPNDKKEAIVKETKNGTDLNPVMKLLEQFGLKVEPAMAKTILDQFMKSLNK